MLRHALRRLFWIPPTLVAITIASFALLSYVPDPADDPRLGAMVGPDQAEELRRSRFLDLPRFYNARPVDLSTHVEEAVAHLAAADARAERAAETLVALGGAAF